MNHNVPNSLMSVIEFTKTANPINQGGSLKMATTIEGDNITVVEISSLLRYLVRIISSLK